MMTNWRRKVRAAATMAAAVAAATGGLVATAPAALADGNCYHYGQPGYGQVFTAAYWNGDCFEWRLGTKTTLPGYMRAGGVESVRGWAAWSGQQWLLGGDAYYGADANTWLGTLPPNVSNNVAWVQ